MASRIEILQELQVRIATVSSMNLILVNSNQRVESSDFPAVEIVTGEDYATEKNESEDYPVYDRVWPWEMIAYIKSTEDESKAFEEVEALQTLIKKAIFLDGARLGNRVSRVSETSTGIYVLPPGGEPGIGILSRWEFRYLESIETIVNS